MHEPRLRAACRPRSDHPDRRPARRMQRIRRRIAARAPAHRLHPRRRRAASAIPSAVALRARLQPPRPRSRPTARRPARTRTDAFGIDQVWVPAGTFTMGTDAKAIAALTAANPPPWVASEFPSEQPAHEVTLTKGYWIDRDEVTNAGVRGLRRRRRLHEPGALVTRGLGMAEREGRDPPAAPLPGRRPGAPPDVPDLVRGGGLRRVAWRPPADRGRVGVRGARTGIARSTRGATPSTSTAPTSSTASLRSRSGATRPASAGSAPTTWPATRWNGSRTGSAADYYATSPATDPTGPATGTTKVEKGGWWGSNEFVARSAYRHYEDPPTYGDKHIGFRVASQ